MDLDLTQLLQNAAPIAGLLFGCFLIYKLALSEDAGKKITDQLQKSKLGIADLFLLIFAFLEGLVAANMGHDALGDTYATRFVNHVALGLVGAFAGFICIKEIIDLVNKFNEKDKHGRRHSALYLTIQALQPLIYFAIAAAMPIFNLIIISKGTGSFEILSLLITDSRRGFVEIFSALDDVTARSLIMVFSHIGLTFAVAVGSIDDVKKPEPKKKKEKGSANRPSVDKSISKMASSLGLSPTDIVDALGKVKDNNLRMSLKEKIQKGAEYSIKNDKQLEEAKQSGNAAQLSKAKGNINQTSEFFNRTWGEIQDANGK